MKLAAKLTLVILLLLALLLNLGAAWLIGSGFSAQLQAAAQQNVAVHRAECYQLQKAMIETPDLETQPPLVVLYGQQRTAQAGVGLAILSVERAFLYSGTGMENGWQPVLRALDAGEDGMTYAQEGAKVWQLFASPVQWQGRTLWLVSSCEVSSVFQLRNQQLAGFARLELIAFAGVALAVWAVSRRLTRPLKALEESARAIAAGSYDRRTGMTGADEVASLAASFDAMAEAVEQRANQLDLAVHQREDFVSAFTHELKTPMTSMLGYADLMRSAEVKPEVRQRAANYIYHETKRLESLSAKLMTFMALDPEHKTLELRPVALAALAERTARALPAEYPVRLCWEGFEAGRVLGDEDLLTSLLENLINNGMRAEPKDGRISITAHRKNGQVEITVRDRGRGIPQKELERITEPFYMVDKSRARAQNGSGFGLALCARIARLHGTRLEFESQPGEGTTVRFTLKEAGE